jgi:hypothetical protein
MYKFKFADVEIFIYYVIILQKKSCLYDQILDLTTYSV